MVANWNRGTGEITSSPRTDLSPHSSWRMGNLGLAPSDLPPPIRVSRSAMVWFSADAGEFKSRWGALRGCVSTQVHQPGGDSAKRRGGCAGRKSRRPDELKTALTSSDRPLSRFEWGAPEMQSATNQRSVSGFETR